MWFKGVELSKEGILVPSSVFDCTRAAIERTMMRSSVPMLEPKSHDRAHYARAQDPRSSTCHINFLIWQGYP